MQGTTIVLLCFFNMVIFISWILLLRKYFKNMIILMEMKDEGDHLQIYTCGNEKIIESFVFIASDGASVQFICIDGMMDRKDLENILINSVQ